MWNLDQEPAHPELTMKDKLNDFGRHGWQVAAVTYVPTDQGPRVMVVFQRAVEDEEPNAGDL